MRRGSRGRGIGLGEVEGHEQHVGVLVDGGAGDEGCWLDGDARPSGMARTLFRIAVRGRGSLVVSVTYRSGGLSAAMATGAPELCGGDRSTEHAGAFRWGLGQCNSCRVPCLGERPEQFGIRARSPSRSAASRIGARALLVVLTGRPVRRVESPDTDRLARLLEQERRGHGDAARAAPCTGSRAERARPRTGVRLDVEVEVKVICRGGRGGRAD